MPKTPTTRCVRLFLVLSMLLGGCAGRTQRADIGSLYSRSATAGELDRNPVIVLPGVLGSRLEQDGTGRVVWGAFAGDYANPDRPDGARLAALPMTEGVPLADLRDDVAAVGVLDRVQVSVIGLPISLSAYRNILMTLGVGGYRDEELARAGAVDYGDDHFTCFQFPYDWRRDNIESARQLHEFILEKEQFVRDQLTKRGITPPERIRFDLVAHSMGGLVSRYYMRYGAADLPEDGSLPEVTWAGAEYVDRLIMVGTPNAGSANAIGTLVHGVKFAPILPTYEAALLGTMPSTYQLLPRDRFGALVDAESGASLSGLYDVDTWIEHGWGLADPGQDRVLQMLLPDVPDAATRQRIARDHLDKCLRARRFHEALDTPAAPPPGLALHLFAGDAEPTDAVVAVDVDTGRIKTLEQRPGDGTVTRSSALMDERLDGRWTPRLRTPIRWATVQFLFANHLGLTKDPIFTDNVLYLLLESPREPSG